MTEVIDCENQINDGNNTDLNEVPYNGGFDLNIILEGLSPEDRESILNFKKQIGILLGD